MIVCVCGYLKPCVVLVTLVLHDNNQHRLIGHGKTEFARKFAELAGFRDGEQFELISCETETTSRDHAIGLGAGFVGGTKRTRLTDFMVRNDGKQSVLILDEFEKSSPDVFEAFLRVFDTGEYVDKSVNNGRVVSCKWAIIILTTNAADDAIWDYCGSNIPRSQTTSSSRTRSSLERPAPRPLCRSSRV